MIGFPDAKFAQKYVAEAWIVVLPRMHQDLVGVAINQLYNQTQPYDFRSGAKDGQDFHDISALETR